MVARGLDRMLHVPSQYTSSVVVLMNQLKHLFHSLAFSSQTSFVSKIQQNVA